MNTQAPTLSRTDRVVLRIIQVVAWVGAVATVVNGTLTTVLPALQGRTAVSLSFEAALPESSGTVAAQSPQWLNSTVWIDGQDARITWLVIAAWILRIVGIALVLAGIAVLADQMARGRAFFEAATVPLGLVLVGVAAAPVLGDALEGWASMLTWDAMGTPAGYGAFMAFSPGAIFFGLVVIAVSILFRVATRAQRDTEGLV